MSQIFVSAAFLNRKKARHLILDAECDTSKVRRRRCMGDNYAAILLSISDIEKSFDFFIFLSLNSTGRQIRALSRRYLHPAAPT